MTLVWATDFFALVTVAFAFFRGPCKFSSSLSSPSKGKDTLLVPMIGRDNKRALVAATAFFRRYEPIVFVAATVRFVEVVVDPLFIASTETTDDTGAWTIGVLDMTDDA